jgi:hypothetical protein
MGLSEYLTADHRRLDALLAEALAGDRFDHDAFEQFRAGLLRHIGIEEKLLLPAARRHGELPPVAETLRLEHAALASLLVPTPDASLAREIAGLLREHNTREEGLGALYEICDSLLGDQADALLAEAKSAHAPPLARHFDGPGTHRTAESALRAATEAAQRRARR